MFRIGAITTSWLLTAFFTPLAGAAGIDDARVSLSSGKYDKAFEQASRIGNPEALLLGAEAINTKLLLGQSTAPKKDAKKAMKIALDILTSNPSNADAKLLYAISYGFYGRSVSPIKAWRKKIPQKIETAILDAITANPDNANSYALYAGWHLGVYAKAGPKTARRMYGANIEDGISNFERAQSLLPDDMMINANYALMLFAIDKDAYKSRIDPLFAAVSAAQPKNSAEVFVQNLVLEVANDKITPKQALKTAENFLGW